MDCTLLFFCSQIYQFKFKLIVRKQWKEPRDAAAGGSHLVFFFFMCTAYYNDLIDWVWIVHSVYCADRLSAPWLDDDFSLKNSSSSRRRVLICSQSVVFFLLGLVFIACVGRKNKTKTTTRCLLKFDLQFSVMKKLISEGISGVCGADSRI